MSWISLFLYVWCAWSSIGRLTPIDGVPNVGSWKQASLKIRNELSITPSNRYQRNNLIIYHVGIPNPSDSQDVNVNNLRYFTSTLNTSSGTQKWNIFTLFNVVGGSSNPFAQYLPGDLKNVVVVFWDSASSDMETHYKTAELLGLDTINKFGAIFMLNQGARGPFALREGNAWIGEYRKLLSKEHNVGLVGSTMSCEREPHVQTHAFAVLPQLFYNISHELLHHHNAKLTWVERISHFEVGFSKLAKQQGYKIASLLHKYHWQEDYFIDTCPVGSRFEANPTSWCNISPNDLIFMKWGGEPLRTKGYICDSMFLSMRRLLVNISYYNPHIPFIIPETSYGGVLYPLYKEYSHELFRDEMINGYKYTITPVQLQESNINTNNNNTTGIKSHSKQDYLIESPSSKEQYSSQLYHIDNYSHITLSKSKSFDDDKYICFLVRTQNHHDNNIKGDFTSSSSSSNGNGNQQQQQQSSMPLSDTGIRDFIRSLLRQSNPYWVSYFIITDRSLPFESRLLKILHHFNDPRLIYFPLDKTYQSNIITATDYALKLILPRSHCKYISITEAANVYGSDVVNRVLNSDRYSGSSSIKDPDLILNPLDSRNFADQEYFNRQSLIPKNSKRLDEYLLSFLKTYLNTNGTMNTSYISSGGNSNSNSGTLVDIGVNNVNQTSLLPSLIQQQPLDTSLKTVVLSQLNTIQDKLRRYRIAWSNYLQPSLVLQPEVEKDSHIQTFIQELKNNNKHIDVTNSIIVTKYIFEKLDEYLEDYKERTMIKYGSSNNNNGNGNNNNGNFVHSQNIYHIDNLSNNGDNNNNNHRNNHHMRGRHGNNNVNDNTADMNSRSNDNYNNVTGVNDKGEMRIRRGKPKAKPRPVDKNNAAANDDVERQRRALLTTTTATNTNTTTTTAATTTASTIPQDTIPSANTLKYLINNLIDIIEFDESWKRRCIQIQSLLYINRYTYVTRPVPYHKHMLISSAFFRRNKLINENIYFGNFSNPLLCKHCEEGYFAEYLVHNRRWNYVQLPIGELKSIIFHGPSPTWCIASGNVWFDHPISNKAGCVTTKTLSILRKREDYIIDITKKTYDFDHYLDIQYKQDTDRVCIRLSKYGYIQSLLMNK